MEYAVQAWSPKLVRDIDKLEKVQRRATKLVPEIRDLPYEVRLRELGLPSLLERRVRGDMIEVFKIVNGFENIDSEQFFKRVEVRDLHSDGPTTLASGSERREDGGEREKKLILFHRRYQASFKSFSD